jgi:hypothetical protein
MSQCRKCRQEIIWAKTLQGHWLAVEPRPEEHGNIELNHAQGERYPVALFHGIKSPVLNYYIPHIHHGHQRNKGKTDAQYRDKNSAGSPDPQRSIRRLALHHKKDSGERSRRYLPARK